jgi:tetraacyldisaccharide 4'-kinase
MEDGLQNPAMYRDYSIVVIDGGAGFGNGRVMPAGPLREYVADGLARADCVVILGEDVSGVEKKIRSLAPDMPVFAAQLSPSVQNIDLKGQKIFAFAGIGRPQKFKATLEKAGALIEGWGEYPDHYLYKAEDLQPLIDAATKANCVVVTTAKDHVRLPQAFKDKVQVYTVDIAWQDAKSLVDHVEKIISQRRR